MVSGIALFIVGRRFQQALDLWRKWRGTLAALPGMEKDARRSVRTLVKVALVTLVVLWAVANMGRFTG